MIATRQHPTDAPATIMIQPAIASSPRVDVDAPTPTLIVTIPPDAVPAAPEPAAEIEATNIQAAGVSSHQPQPVGPQRAQPTPAPRETGPGQLSEAEMVGVLQAAGWPSALIPAALAVSWCESKWSPGALGDGGVSVGLFQIGRSRPGWNGWFIYFGIDESNWANPLTNAYTALLVYQHSGWSPWTCRRVL